MMTFRKIMTVLCAGILILSGACKKQPEAPKEIVIAASSRAVFSSGMNLDYTGPQTQSVSFTAPDSWMASAEDTKAPGWLALSPASGAAGDVTMKVTVQANDSYDERSAKVTIKSAGKSASFTVRQAGKPVPVESVKLDRETLELTEGESATLKATVSPERAADKTVTWSSSDESKATVDASGKVTAVKEGKVKITAKAGDKTATCAVTVVKKVVAVESVTLDKEALELTEGESATLKATVAPDDATDKTVSWSSSNASVASVDASGKVTAVKAGSATITAKAGDKTATCAVTVKAKETPQPPAPVAVTSVTLNKTALELTEGESDTLTATVKPDNATDKTVTWTSGNTAVATVDASGKVTAVKAGSATITAKAGDKTATCAVTVKAKETNIPVASITLNKTRVTLHPGESETLTATISPDNATDKTLTWTSSYPAAVTVDANGKITAVAVGAAAIHVSCGGKSATCEVTVDPIAVTGVTLDKTSLSLAEGESATLKATVAPDNATNKTVTWTSGNTAVATVDASGKVTAVKAGSATITAKAGDKTASCTVTVTAQVIAVTSVTLDKTSLSLTEGDSATLTATVNPSDATDKTISWSSSNPAVAAVDNSGNVTAVKEGSATITAKAGDKSATCPVTVAKKVIAVESVTLDKTTLGLVIGDDYPLHATVNPSDATDQTVTWSSSETRIATVDASGKVTAVSVGSATITAKAGDKSATCSVTVNPMPVSTVTLDKTTLELTTGESATLTATVGPDNATDKTVTWSTSDATIASVDSAGKVTAGRAGTATITAKAGEVTATCTVKVTVPAGGSEGMGEEIWN